MKKDVHAIHLRALEVSENYLKNEGELIDILQDLDSTRGYLEYDSSSLYEYCQTHLKLSDGTTSNLIAISRKAKEIPALKLAVQKAVACAKPALAVKETMKYKAKDRIERVVGISEELNEKLRKVIDLESQRTKKPASFEDALEAMVELYLERNDPVRKAERAQKKEKLRGTCHVKIQNGSSIARETTIHKRAKLPAALIHAVTIRDQRRCTHVDSQGQRCSSARWLDVHHILPISRGGRDEPNNLTTLCSAHHHFIHRSGLLNRPEQRSD